jgi:hypothetical protein
MIYDLANWPDKRYSGWKERGRGYEGRPNIGTCVDKTRNSSYDKKKLIAYLNKGHSIVASSWYSFPCLFTGKRRTGSFLILTDGNWEYDSELVGYIRDHDLAIPDQWYSEIVSRDFKMPNVSKEALYAMFPPPPPYDFDTPGENIYN